MLGSSDAPTAETIARDPEPGDTVGRYVLVGRLGAGGMGVVMAAYDPRLDRTVALKFMRADRATDAMARRLEREAHALAKLAHPHLVRVYDAGLERGRLYLAMELVDGVTLRMWLEEQERTTEEIVRVFSEIAAGLSAVHAAGFVHRDIKPDNVMIDRDGSARVADFGLVARINVENARDQESATRLSSSALSPSAPSPSPALSSGVLPMTEPFTAVGTPAYMAPEQKRGASVTARTDQWSWGTALAEALGARQVSARIRRVIARATHDEPSARFTDLATAAGALVPSTRRAWPWVVGGAMVVAAATVVLAQRGGAESADPCLAEARAVTAAWEARGPAIATAFEATGHPSWKGRFEATERAARGAASLWSDAMTSVCRTAKARAVDAEAACLDQQRANAVSLFDELARADRKLVDQGPLATSRLPRPAACLEANVLEHVRAPMILGAPLAAELAAHKAKAGLRPPADVVDGLAALAARAKVFGAAQIEGEARLLLGEMQSRLRRDGEANATLEEAAQAAARARDDRVTALARLLQAGQAALLTTDRDRATTLGQVAAAAVERAGNPSELRAQLENIRGGIAYARGEYEAARAHYLASVAARIETFGPDAPTVAHGKQNLALALGQLGKKDEARRETEEALAMMERVLGADHPELAVPLNTLGTHLADAGKLDEALGVLERAKTLRVAAFGPDHPDVVTTNNNLGKLAQLRGDPRAAIGYLGESVATLERTRGKDVVELAMPLSGLGAAHADLAAARADLAEWATAQRFLERAIALAELRRGPDHPALISMLITFANVRANQHDVAGQRAALTRALAIAKAKLGPDHARTKELVVKLETVK
ncbi:MAG: serine/threonine-protein kinase [Kofleriaceae bacterium]|nr:serine/threonine-protein kinase [Kofleriaceae bacterium]